MTTAALSFPYLNEIVAEREIQFSAQGHWG